MSAVRSYDDAFLRQLHQSVAPSIVQLAVFNAKSTRIPCHLGTGLVLCATPNYIGVITSASCDPKDGFRVVARFGDQENLETEVVRTSSLLSALVVRGCNVQARPCIPTSFHEGDLLEGDVVFCIGCFSIVKEQIMTTGQISYLMYARVCEFEKELRGEKQVSTFVHTCPIGDGLMGAPICSRSGKVFGMNVARTAQCSSINFALNNSQLKVELAKLLQNEDYEMSALIEKYDSEKTSASKKRRERGVSSSQMSRSPVKRRAGGSSSSRRERGISRSQMSSLPAKRKVLYGWRWA
uniref:Serine protease n=1 Tax=Oryza punctata TaxID=4537 RepID=A0A0E0M1L9_ORYPU